MQVKRFKLYHSPILRSTRVKWLLHELLADDFDVEIVDVYGAALFDPQYLELNPMHAVPILQMTLEDGDVVSMTESGAMLGMLADMFPARRLAPPANAFSRERADYLQMLHFAASSMDMMLWQVRVNENVLREHERDARTAQRYRHKLVSEVTPMLAKRLETNQYICGDEFTAVDCIMGHNILWAQMCGACSTPVFGEYVQRIANRPAFIKAFADRDQFVRTVPDDAPLHAGFSG